MVQTARKNNISGQAKIWLKPASPSSTGYRNFDSRCDCQGYVGLYSCLFDCPFDHCKHDFEAETLSRSTKIAVSQINEKRSTYASIPEDY